MGTGRVQSQGRVGQGLVEDAVKDVQAKYKADRALLKETYKALPTTVPGPSPPQYQAVLGPSLLPPLPAARPEA